MAEHLHPAHVGSVIYPVKCRGTLTPCSQGRSHKHCTEWPVFDWCTDPRQARLRAISERRLRLDQRVSDG